MWSKNVFFFLIQETVQKIQNKNQKKEKKQEILK